jgi:hypothetical protein
MTKEIAAGEGGGQYAGVAVDAVFIGGELLYDGLFKGAATEALSLFSNFANQITFGTPLSGGYFTPSNFQTNHPK